MKRDGFEQWCQCFVEFIAYTHSHYVEAEDAVRDIEKEKVIRAQRQKVVDAHETAWEKFTSKASAAAEGGGLLNAEDVPVPYGGAVVRQF